MSQTLKLASVVLLSIVFSIALLYLTVETPRIINNYLLSSVAPDQPFNIEYIEGFTYWAKIAGYLSLVTVVALIILGYLIEKSKLSVAGSLALFIPTFGYFAFTMFFLAGLGVLYSLWLPLMDLSPTVFMLGDVIYLPYLAIEYPLSLLGIDISVPFAMLFMFLGLLIFIMGSVSWLYFRFSRQDIVSAWIYRYSRHPQYLGFILWSYGLTILATKLPYVRGGYFPEPGFPMLISTLVLVSTALYEETMLIKKSGIQYINYRNSAPFMLPIPKTLSRLLKLPVKALIGKEYPETKIEVAIVFLIYLFISVLLSIPFPLLGWRLR